MKKAGAIVLILILLSVFGFSIVKGQADQPPLDKVDNAYQCLEDLIDEKDESDLSLQEAIFSILAVGSDSKLKNVIQDAKDNNEDCWPSGSCTIKDTAQVLLAYERINKNTAEIESWLLEKAGTATELTWFLQIDISNRVESTCTLTYQDTDKTITVNEDMTISGGPGQCFSISSSGFWLRVSNDCIEEDFRISCEEDFITSLLYQRQGSDTIFVSPTTHSSAALGTTEEKINSKCFKLGGSCNYEGSLWAALALDNVGEEISAYLPYLLALSSENTRIFPNTFLYILTQGDDQYSEIVQSQQQGQYWQAPNTLYNRFYDTALAMLALQSSNAIELTNAQSYLLQIQTPEGCWNNNNIRDTAFVLYAGWPTSVPGESGGAGGGATESCISQGFDCNPSLFSCSDIGGSVLDYDCDFGVCCSVSLVLPSCSAQDGIVCSATQSCTGIVVDSFDGSCCLDSCIEVQKENDCQISGGGCFTSCTKDEEQLSESCDDTTLVCCKAKEDTGGGFGIWIWIIILFILIVIIVLAIIYRKKIQLLWYKFKNRRKGKGAVSSGLRRPPGYPPPYGPRQLRRPNVSPGVRRQMVQGAPMRKSGKSKTDKELEETLKKLKKMSE